MTQHEKGVFELLIANYSTKETARLMNIPDETVRDHISSVMLKLGVKGRAQAVVELLRLEELTLEQAGRESILSFFYNTRVQRTGEGVQDVVFETQGYEVTIWERRSIRA